MIFLYNARLISRVGYFAKAAVCHKIPELCHRIVGFYKRWSALSSVLQQPQARVNISIVSFLHLALLELASSCVCVVQSIYNGLQPQFVSFDNNVVARFLSCPPLLCFRSSPVCFRSSPACFRSSPVCITSSFGLLSISFKNEPALEKTKPDRRLIQPFNV